MLREVVQRDSVLRKVVVAESVLFQLQGGGGPPTTTFSSLRGGGPRLLQISLVAPIASGRPGKKDSVLGEVVVAESPSRRRPLRGSLCYEK